MSFTTGTAPVPPGASTGTATSVSSSGATLNGNVNPNGSATQAWFEWGTSSSALTSSTPAQPVGSGTSSQSFNHNLTGLGPGTTYYYRVAASNSAGTMKGTVVSFTTTTLPPPSSGSVTLAWDPPTTKTDGSPLPSNEIDRYVIYYGASSGNYTQSVNAGNVTQFTVTDLSTGTWYFAVTVYDTSGYQSDFSEEIFTQIQ